MDFSKAFINPLNNLPCLSCGVVRKKHGYVFHKYVDPIGEKERTSIKTKRGMKNECIRDLEIYDRNNDYEGHLLRLDVSGSFRGSDGVHKQNESNKSNESNKLNKLNKSKESKELRGLEDLTLSRDLDGYKSRNNNDKNNDKNKNNNSNNNSNNSNNNDKNNNNDKINTRCTACNIPKNKHYMVNCVYQKP